MKISIWLAIVLSAVLAFVIGYLYNEELHWYLFILIICTGFFIHTIITILKNGD